MLLERSATARAWAVRALVGCVLAWGLGVGACAVVVARSSAHAFVWTVGLAGRTGYSPAFVVDLEREHVVLVATVLLLVPVVLAALGLEDTRDRVRHAVQHDERLRSRWSPVPVAAAVALLPNLLGCLWVSGNRPGPDLMVVPQAWPLLVAVLGPVAWVVVTYLLPWRGTAPG